MPEALLAIRRASGSQTGLLARQTEAACCSAAAHRSSLATSRAERSALIAYLWEGSLAWTCTRRSNRVWVLRVPLFSRCRIFVGPPCRLPCRPSTGGRCTASPQDSSRPSLQAEAASAKPLRPAHQQIAQRQPGIAAHHTSRLGQAPAHGPLTPGRGVASLKGSVRGSSSSLRTTSLTPGRGGASLRGSARGSSSSSLRTTSGPGTGRRPALLGSLPADRAASGHSSKLSSRRLCGVSVRQRGAERGACRLGTGSTLRAKHGPTGRASGKLMPTL